jgi:PPOX class probable F420-dependent enzyme
MAEDIDRAKYIAFVSKRRNGSPVSTPVWVVPFDDGYAFTTDANAWKVKRIANDPAVTIQACGMRGKPKPGAPVHSGRAVVVPDTDVARVQDAVRSKYPIAYKLLIERSDRKAAREGGSRTVGTAAIKVVLED